MNLATGQDMKRWSMPSIWPHPFVPAPCYTTVFVPAPRIHPNWKSPHFPQGDELFVKVNKLTSIKTQIPYSYYTLPFCKPDGTVNGTPGLWEVLSGDREEISPYVVQYLWSIHLYLITMCLIMDSWLALVLQISVWNRTAQEVPDCLQEACRRGRSKGVHWKDKRRISSEHVRIIEMIFSPCSDMIDSWETRLSCFTFTGFLTTSHWLTLL